MQSERRVLQKRPYSAEGQGDTEASKNGQTDVQLYSQPFKIYGQSQKANLGSAFGDVSKQKKQKYS